MKRKNKNKLFSAHMLLFEFRKTIGNPYVHIFGVGMPILMMIVISRVIVTEVADAAFLPDIVTSVFLGTGTLIPMASIFMGYGVAHAQELEKGIPQRMALFGIKERVSLFNCALSEVIFMLIAFCVYCMVGYAFIDVTVPRFSGAVLYIVCILALSVILFCMAHAISALLKKFSLTYCVTMLLYFGFMIFGGMMGITYDNMPAGMQQVAKLLPITYINRDFSAVWNGESYNFAPMLQAYLFLAAAAGILFFLAMKRTARKLH